MSNGLLGVLGISVKTTDAYLDLDGKRIEAEKRAKEAEERAKEAEAQVQKLKAELNEAITYANEVNAKNTVNETELTSLRKELSDAKYQLEIAWENNERAAMPVTSRELQAACVDYQVTEALTYFALRRKVVAGACKGNVIENGTILVPKYDFQLKTRMGAVSNITDGKVYPYLVDLYKDYLPDGMASEVNFLFVQPSEDKDYYFLCTPDNAEYVIMSFIAESVLEEHVDRIFYQHQIDPSVYADNAKHKDKELFETHLLLEFPLQDKFEVAPSTVNANQVAPQNIAKGRANDLRKRCASDFNRHYYL